MIQYKKFAYFSALLLGIGLALVRLLQDSIGPNATDASFEERYTASLFMPEGWGFFTRSPRETKFVLYHASATGQPADQVTYRNSSAQNLFGLSRRSRRLSVEFSRITPVIPANSWHALTDKSTQRHPLPATTVAYSPQRFRLLKPGTYLVKKYNLAPWAWVKFPGHFSATELYATIILK